MDIYQLLEQVEVLADFDGEALRRLAKAARVADYSSGQRILRLGQTVEAVGVVASGG